MSAARYIVGDVLEQLRKLPDDSVDLVFSSPPFLALRSYLPPEHPDKAKEIGSEPTPGEFIDALLDVTEECARVLAPHGSLCFELGDTYSGSGGSGGDYNPDGLREGQQAFDGSASRNRQKPGGRTTPQRRALRRDAMPGILPPQQRRGRKAMDNLDGWPLDKSLCLIPELYRVALVYGVNPLTGRTTERWRGRNVIRWHRTNPSVGRLGDKYRPATSDIIVACKSADRYFDLDAVRTRHEHEPHRDNRGGHRREGIGGRSDQMMNPTDEDGFRIQENPRGAPPLDTWIIPTAGYPGSHYAVFPPALVIRPLLSMCPERVCLVCGEPSRRITEQSQTLDPSRPQAKRAMELADAAGLTADHLAAVYATGITDAGKAKVTMNGKNSAKVQMLAGEAKETLGGYFREFTMSNQVTTGWTDCGHDSWRNGVTLDPFAGSGTVGEVATGHGRNAVLIDIDERNAQLAIARIGGFLCEVSGDGEPLPDWLVSPLTLDLKGRRK